MMNEEEKIRNVDVGSEHTGNESLVVTNPAKFSQDSDLCHSYDKIDTIVANVGKERDSNQESVSIEEQPEGENLLVSEHQEVHTVSRSSQRGQPYSTRRQTVFWEPLMMETEVDGKREVVTALKRVDSNYISGPRIPPKIVIQSNDKESDFSKTKTQQPVTPTFSSIKGKASKVSGGKIVKQGVKKDINTKKKMPDINISEQMGKAIAEKEAVIMKEIAKAMQEATDIKNKLILPISNVTLKGKANVAGDQAKSKFTVKINPVLSDKKRNVDDDQGTDIIEPDVPKDVTCQTKEEKTKVSGLKSFLNSSNLETAGVTRSRPKLIQLEDEKKVSMKTFLDSNPEKAAVTRKQTKPVQLEEEKKKMVNLKSFLNSSNTETTYVSRTQTKPMQTAVISPVLSTVGKDLRGLTTVMTTSGRILTVPTSVGKPTSRETQSTSSILSVPGTVVVSTSSSGVVSVPKNAQALSNVCGPSTVFTSPVSTAQIPTKDSVNKLITVPSQHAVNEMPRFLFVTSPSAGGSLPLLTPIITTSSLPVIHTPVTSYSKTKLRSSTKARKTVRDAENKSKEVNVATPKISQEVHSESANTEHTDLDINPVGNSFKDSKRKSFNPEEQLTSKLEVSSPPLTSVNTTPLVQAVKQFSSSASQKSVDQNIENMLTNIKSSSDEQLIKQGKDNKATKYVTSEKNSTKVDSNGENMDIDDEFISEELDQGFVDDTRTVNGQKTVRIGKKTSSTQESEHDVRDQRHLKTASQKALRKSSAPDTSEETLENRLQRIEQLYNEIPPVQSRISFTADEFSQIKDSFRDSMRAVKAVTASFLNLVNESSSLDCKEYATSACQTETSEDTNVARNVDTNVSSVVDTIVVGNVDTKTVANVGTDKKSDEVKSDPILCRLCGGFFSEDTMTFLFEKISAERNVLSMLCTILPQTTVKESDGLPQQICRSCLDKMTLCHTIISQFLQADKELRKALSNEKPDVSNGSGLEAESHDSNVKASTTNEQSVPSPADGDEASASTNPTQNRTEGQIQNQPETERIPKDPEEAQVPLLSQKRTHTVENSERSSANSGPNQKRKRRRSKSPRSGSNLPTNSSSAPSKSSGCIDLSRLDPEFNIGFEVEWCLDEETIRSSMVPEEDMAPALNGDSAGSAVPGSAEKEKSSAKLDVEARAEIPSGTSETLQTASFQAKAKDSLGSETPKLKDEVSKLTEVHTSVSESPVKFDPKQSPVSSLLEERCNPHANDITSGKFKCSSCSLSFPSKQKALSHQVVHHDEELMGGRETPEQDRSSMVKTKTFPQKQIGSLDFKFGSDNSEEPVMCDKCGLPFPEHSLRDHKCIVNENLSDSLLAINDSKGLENKIFDSKESLNENMTNEDMSETSSTDGKILVKCGHGMLWVNSSKYFSEEQEAAIQSKQGGTSHLNADNDPVSSVLSEKSLAYLTRGRTKLKFAYKCDHCKRIFVSKSELLTHMRSHEEEYSCNECCEIFPSTEALNSHFLSHIPPDRICEDCGLILLDSKKLLQHKKEHSHNFPNVCETCGKRFPNEQTLEVHESVHFNKKGPLACSLCRKCFFFKHSLVRHRSQHASNRLQKCSLCFRILNSSEQLRKHVALHHLMKNFVCFCKQTFPSQKELVEHRYLKHSYAEIFCARNKVEIVEPLPLHQCSICFRVLNSKQSLMKHHVASHSSTWPFYCIQCSRKYTSMFHLERHECHRKNMTAYQCRICGKAFQDKNTFRQHKIIHDNRKWVHVCRHCGKAFLKSQTLVDHIMTHGGKKFVCPRCHVSCQDRAGLLKHYNKGSCQMKRKFVQ